MWLTFKEAAVSEGPLGSRGQCPKDNFVFGKGGYNKIVVLVLVVPPSETPVAGSIRLCGRGF